MLGIKKKHKLNFLLTKFYKNLALPLSIVNYFAKKMYILKIAYCINFFRHIMNNLVI